MQYDNIHKAAFIKRLNRFTAEVKLGGETILCHIKNTGRLGELLQKDATVYLVKSGNTLRKTAYDLVAVKKDGEIFNIDSFAPNEAAEEYLKAVYPEAKIRREVTFGNSRFDFYIENRNKKIFLEVKGVTLIKDGTALFPDAPTERGIKHINELIKCKNDGYEAQILFVIQTEKVSLFAPNSETHPEFGHAIEKALENGVEIKAVNCTVTPSEMIIQSTIPQESRTHQGF